MMFPKDRTVYSNLNTSFTDFDELMLDLRSKHVTGYVLVSFRGYDGMLFLDNGEVVSAMEQEGDTRGTDAAASERIAARAHEKGGVVNVYTLAPELLRLLVRSVDAQVLFKDLTSSFTSLDRLIDKLEEDRHSGFIEVSLADGRGGGMIFFDNGRVVECVFASEGANTSGTDILQGIVQVVGSAGASFNVFKAAPPPAPTLVGSLTGADDEAAAGPPANPLAVWSEIIAAVESVVDGLAHKGRFLTTFKEVLVERASTYPFLDPFAAEFQYRDGQIEFEGPLPPDFNKGIGDCLSDSISRLAFQLKRADLETRIRNRLGDFPERNSAVIEKLHLSDDIQEFVA
jgi:hypothetical protein